MKSFPTPKIIPTVTVTVSSRRRNSNTSGLLLTAFLQPLLIAAALFPVAHSFTFSKTLSSTISLAMSSETETETNTETITITDKPFGAWESPISSRSITAGSVKISGLTVLPSSNGDGNDSIYWLEGRPLEGGRNVFCQWTGGEVVTEITPRDTNVRTRVHEYGGAATTLAGDTLFYSDFASQQVYQLSLSPEDTDDASAAASAAASTAASATAPTLVTNGPAGQYRYADGIFDSGLLICVREDHGQDGKAAPKDVINEIVALDVATGQTRVLVKGYDFAAAPRLSNDKKTLACIVWDHPNMPWDATKLVTVALPETIMDEDSPIGSPLVIAGEDGDTSVMQPLFHPTTGKLLYISDESGYYNLYALDETTGISHSMLPMEVDFGGASPGWMLGQMGYTVLEDGKLAATISRDGSSVLVVLDVESWETTPGKPFSTVEFTSKDGLPMQFGSVQAGTNGNLYFMGGDPSTPASVYRWNSNDKGPAIILKSSSKSEFGTSVISVPRQIEFPTTLGTAFGYYYPPKNGNFECTTEAAPPLLVKAHGG